MHSTLTYLLVFVVSAAKLSLFHETNKYFARKIAFPLTFSLNFLPLKTDFFTFKIVDKDYCKILYHL